MDEDANLTSDQTEKIIHFQEITHIDSFDMSVDDCCEAHDWNIESAVQSAFNDPLDIPPTPTPPTTTTNATTSTTNTQQETDEPNEGHQFNDDDLNHQYQQLINSHHSNSMNNMPQVNIITQRTLSYHNVVRPQGILGWSYFIFAFPIRLFYTTFSDIFSFIWNLLSGSSSANNNNGRNNANFLLNYDPLANIAEFAIDYNQTYGANNHPNFYEGSYGQAVNEAKRNFRYLLIYLHQNNNEDCNKFATETLANADVINYINNSVLFWACSRDLPEGKKVFDALKARRSPFLGLIVLRQNKMTLVTKIEGPIGAIELIARLTELVNEFQGELAVARHERDIINQSQILRQQQDQAYAECLKADQEKSRKQRELEEVKKKQLEEERKLIEDEKRKKEEILLLKAELKRKLEEEPEIDASLQHAIKLILKLPSGRRLERVFLKTDPVKCLYSFLYCHDECPTNFEIVTNFPRRVIECSLETETPLEQCGITQSMLLMVNDLDA